MTAKNAYRTVKKFSKSYPDTQSNEYNLICDNMYLIKQRVAAVGKARRTALRGNVEKYLVRSGYSFSTDGLIEYFSSHGLTLWISDVYSLSDILCTLLVCAVAEQCTAFTENGRGSMSVMRSAVESLRRLPELELSAVFASLCPTEKLLEEYGGFSHGDDRTKDSYREAVAAKARRRHTDECTVLAEAAKKCRDGRLLAVLSPFSPLPAVAYYTLTFGLSAAVSYVSFRLWGVLALFASLPVTEGAFCLGDFVFSRLTKAKPAPRISPEHIPPDAQTLVVITTLLFGGKKDGELFSRLEEYYLRNDRPELRFGILGDLCDAKNEHMPDDGEIISSAISAINKLNDEYGGIFSLFVRERTQNKADGIYGGRERKRGAVTELIDAINGGKKPHVCLCPFELEKTQFVLTLDGDTELPIDGADELLCVALHPENAPQVKNGRVICGHGIFQPSIRTRLSDSTKTYHSLFGSHTSGLYERASYDRYQTLLGSGVFCGKGLINARLFSSIVKPAVPDGIILSHDVIEGSLLRCMLVSDTAFCDSTPKNSISFFRRQHRWIRGDVQNLSILGGLSCAALDFRLLENLRRLLTPVFAATGLIAAAFFADNGNALPLLLLFTVNLWLPSSLGLIGTAFSRSYTPRRFFSRCVSAIAQTAEGFFYSFCALAENATVTTDALTRSLWRITVSKKHLLSWTTFSQTDTSGGGISLYLQSHVSGVFIGTLMVAFSPLTVYKICGLLWFLFPVTAYITSFPVRDKSTVVTDAQRRTVTEYATEIFAFFDENVTKKTHFLPPDNIQLSPAECIAYRTSPTNIGFYIICLLAARDFGLIDSEALGERTENVLTTIEGLEKCRGHLFNWYDIKTLKPIGGKYVSTVDSGNLVTMLLCAASGLDEYSAENGRLSALAERCRAIAESADFSIMYNQKKHLLYLGCDRDGIPQGSICYDMLMSEIRTTCYWLCATGRLPKKLWQSLSRTITAENGYIGMVSWAGSCFEYFMPELFLSRERDSFIDESMRFALSMQRRCRKNGVFGISESGYFAFDPEMNYRYKAHGVPELALKRYSPREFVVSPYSSFLMMRDGASSCLKNLALLEEMGCRGKYGFYEALDLSNGESTVQSYMSHHLGMSLTACANLCFDDIFVKRFMRYKRLYACRELLAESIPKDAMLYIGENSRIGEGTRRAFYPHEITDDKISLADPKASFVTGGGLTLISSSSGHIAMKCGLFGINDTQFSLYKNVGTACFTFFENGKKQQFSPLDGNMSFSYEYSGSRFAFTSSSPRFPASVIGTVYKGCRTFAFKTRCSGDRSCRVGFSFIPIIAKQDEYSAHPSFSSLFVEASYDATRRILFFSRRGGSYPHIAVALADASAKPSFASNRDHINAHSLREMSDVFPLPSETPSSGACIEPLCALLTPEIKGGSAVFLVSCGSSRDECAEQIEKARRKQFPVRSVLPPDANAAALLSDCLFKKPATGLLRRDSSCLWKFSLSGTLPLAVLEVFEETPAVQRLLSAYSALKNAFIPTELLFIVHEREKYSAPLKGFIEREMGADRLPFQNRTGGIAVASADELDGDELSFLRAYAIRFSESGSDGHIRRNAPVFVPPTIHGGGNSVGETVYNVEGRVTDTLLNHPAPFSYVMSGYACGCVVTHKALGFVFWRNARECRVTPFDGNPSSECYGLRILAFCGGRYHDIASSASAVTYCNGVAVYSGEIDGIGYTLKVYARSKLAAVDYVLDFKGDRPPTCIIIKEQPSDMTSEKRNGTWLFQGMRHAAVPFTGFMTCLEKCELINDSSLLFCGTSGDRGDILAMKCKESHVKFSIGGAPTASAAANTAALCGADDKSDEARDFSAMYTPRYLLHTGNNGIDSLFSAFAPYQTAISRFFGKTGFYQTGGAFGFRDQLQDCFCLIYSSPEAVRRHIIRCAAHQYREGDVMHWWFRAPNGDTGIRTRCSDDFLFLPWVVADYIEKTGDTDILSVEAPYMESPPLERGENERYEVPKVSDMRESIYMHCIRALANGEKTGSHGLSLMGSCDWNDGFSKIGVGGIGESVFTSWLYVLVCREFLPVMKLMDDTVGISHFAAVSANLLLSLERHAYDGDRYIRAFDDAGRIIGGVASKECSIDILSQAFAAIVLGKTERTADAMNTALERLFDRRSKIFKLFDPPFEKYDAGYITSYCAGLRENGGQYTHGALWGVLGLLRLGETAKAIEVLSSIIPCSHTDERLFRCEPYVITADIYGGGKSGRGGWSWYTGSASWFFVILLEEILGIRLYNGFSELDVRPLIDYTLDLKLPRGNITVCVSSLFASTTLDGEAVKLPVVIPDGEHRLEVRRSSSAQKQ